MILNDFDRVDETNLPRQILYRPEDVGALKVEAAKLRLAALNPAVRITARAERLDRAELEALVGAVDVVLDGTDNFATRFAVNRACVARRVPLVSGAAVRFEGQIAVFGNRGDEPCYSCLYTDEDEWLGDCQGNGVLAPVPGVIGTLMAVEALKVLLGEASQLRGHLFSGMARVASGRVLRSSAIRPAQSVRRGTMGHKRALLRHRNERNIRERFQIPAYQAQPFCKFPNTP